MNLKWRRRRVWGRMKRTKWPFVTKTLIERVLLFLSLSLSTHTHTHTNKRRRLLADLGPFRDTVQRLQRVSMESERHISLRGKGAKKKNTHTHTNQQTNKQTKKRQWIVASNNVGLPVPFYRQQQQRQQQQQQRFENGDPLAPQNGDQWVRIWRLFIWK